MKKITNLLDASKGGIVFGESVKKSLESKILEMYESTSLDKLIKFLEILNVLANTEDFKILNAGNFYIQTLENGIRIVIHETQYLIYQRGGVFLEGINRNPFFSNMNS